MSSGRLQDKVCVITAGTQSLGVGTARLFAREGATVALVDADETNAVRTVAEISALGGSVAFVRSDMGSRADADSMVGEILRRFGRVDVLVNCADVYSRHTPLEQKTALMFDAVLNANYYSTLWAMQAVFPAMRDNGGGRIVNYCSPGAVSGEWYTSDNNVSRAAIASLTNTAAAEWAQYRILCNCVAPLITSSHGELSPSTLSDLTNTVALGRLGDPESDIAPVTLFLASGDSGYVTGSIIQVDGGRDLSTEPWHVTEPE